MNYLIWLPVGYIIFLLALTIIKSLHKSMEKLIFCTTCIAFFLMIPIGFFYDFDPIILSFMIGMSVTGIATKLKEPMKHEFVSQLVLTIIGLIVVSILLLKGG